MNKAFAIFFNDMTNLLAFSETLLTNNIPYTVHPHSDEASWVVYISLAHQKKVMELLK